MNTENTLLDIEDLHVSFFTPAGEVKAVTSVTYNMKHGEVLGIVGESGSGKSVSAYSLMGIIADPGKIVGGTISFNGHEHMEKMTEKEFRKIRGSEISIIFQDPMTSLNPVYTIGNQLIEMLRLHTTKTKKECWDRAVELLHLVGMNEPEKRMKQYPHEFSGGQRQRIGIARALAVNPEFIVCDEPISALDVSIQAQIVNMFEDLQQELGLTYLFIAHDLAIVKHISNRIGVMYLGKLVELAGSSELYKNPIHPYTRSLLSAIPIPDPKASRAKKRIVLEGDVPSPVNPPSGCRFRTRCPYATERCAAEVPEFKDYGGGHYAACHRIGEV